MTAMNVALASLVGPEFLVSGPVQTAIVVGGGAALVSAVIGVFTVMRGQSFAGHALADVSSAGGAASLLLGIHPLLGFLIMAVLAAVGMDPDPSCARARSCDRRRAGCGFGARRALPVLRCHLA